MPLWTNILALWNPIGSGKNLNVLQIDMGVSAGGSISVISQIVLVTAIGGGVTDLSANIIKYNPNSPTTIAKIYAGGSLTLGEVLDRRTINFSNGMPPYGKDFKQEFVLVSGNGLCVIHESETAGNTYLPWATYNWFES